MKIVLCTAAEAPRIAYEDLDGSREGEFYLDPEGIVRFSHPADGHVWFAAPDVASFRSAVECWNKYRGTGSVSGSVAQRAAVDLLRERLSTMGLLPDRPDALWPILLEQVEAGLL